MQQKYRFFLTFLLLIVGTAVSLAAFKDFSVQVNNQEGTFLTADEQVQGTAFSFGVAVSAEGVSSRVAADDASSVATVSGKYHSDHGATGLTVVVPVEGNTIITVGNCTFSSSAVTVKNSNGETVVTKTPANPACWKNNRDNVMQLTYVGDATTLTISGMAYCPFVKVEKTDVVIKKFTTTFVAGDEAFVGTLPTAIEVTEGESVTVPLNRLMYLEGYTLTGWSTQKGGAGDVYAVGSPFVPTADVTLYPVFKANAVKLSDRTDAVTLRWDFQRKNGAPTIQAEGASKNFTFVTQAEVNGTTIDVPMSVDVSKGKFANGNWDDWAQLNGGTVLTIPSCKGATVSIEAYNELGTGNTPLTIDGQSDYTSGKTISYTIANTAATIDAVIGTEGSYYRYIQTVLPVVQSQGGESYDNAVATIECPFNDANDVSAYTATPAGVFSTVAVNTGDLTITGSASRSADDLAQGITFIKFKPAGTTTAVQWVAKPAAGLTFTPTKVSLWIQRFGTDAENGVTVTAKVGEGEAVTLGNFTAPRANQGVDKDKYAGNSNWANHVEITLTAEQQALLASSEELTLSATVGVGSSKEGGFSDVILEGLISGTKSDVAMYTLATAVVPEEAGNINVYPVSEQYEEGTDVKLTATENFGYDFVSWTDAAGAVVSEEPVFTYTMNGDATLMANFKKVNTYELKLTVDGTNDYMVTVSPEPTLIDGKWMYEYGTVVQLQANQYEGLVTFTNWSDGETNSSKLVSMTSDVNITANYAEADIIAGWDFYKAGSNGRKADFAAQDNDADALNLVNTADPTQVSGWLDKSTIGGGGYESFAGAAVNWRTGSSNGDVGNWHWQTKVNAEAFTDIKVQFQMLYNYNAYQTYLAEYSLDGENWTGFGTITMTGAKQVASFSGKLPAAANNQKELYIRMRADKTSNVDGASSANDGNTLAMFFITGTPKLIDDGKAPVLVSTVPAMWATGASATGKIVLTFDERVKVKEGAVGYVNDTRINSVTQNPTTPIVSGKTITFEYKGLEYSKEYNFMLPDNTVSDLTDNYTTESIGILFTTMTRPVVDKKMYDAVVENVDELLAAITAAQSRADKNVRYRIFIKNGEYTIPVDNSKKVAKAEGYEVPECITFINTDNLSIIGESRDGVIITNGIDKNETFAGTYGTTSKYDGIGNSDVFQLRGQGYYWQDLTVETGMDDATGRDLAIHDRGTQNIYKNVGLRGYQDTWTSNNDNGLYYFEDGYVRGRTDYMCGKGDIFWNRVELRQIAGGYAAVPSKPKQYGWIYKDCTINGEGAFVDAAKTTWRSAESVDGNYTLGRPWGSGTPIALFIDTKMNVVPSAIGWNEMSGGWPARFAEYNSMTSAGSQIDLSGRKKTFGDGHENNPVLTPGEAGKSCNLHRMYGDWDPTLYTEQAPLPANVLMTGNTLTWDYSEYALLWAVVKNGKVVAFTTTPSYTVDDTTATYAVRAANEMGGLGEAVLVGGGTGINNVNVNDNVNGNAVTKVFRNGQVVITKNKKQFNALGAEMK